MTLAATAAGNAVSFGDQNGQAGSGEAGDSETGPKLTALLRPPGHRPTCLGDGLLWSDSTGAFLPTDLF